MVNRKWINDLVEPGKAGTLSQIYDYLMLVAIVMGTVPLLFREYRPLFWYSLSIISSLLGIGIIAMPSSIITAGYMQELNRRLKEEEEDPKAEISEDKKES